MTRTMPPEGAHDDRLVEGKSRSNFSLPSRFHFFPPSVTSDFCGTSRSVGLHFGDPDAVEQTRRDGTVGELA